MLVHDETKYETRLSYITAFVDLGMAVDPAPPGGGDILATMISWYYNIYATKWGMLALWEVSRYDPVTSKLHTLPLKC